MAVVSPSQLPLPSLFCLVLAARFLSSQELQVIVRYPLPEHYNSVRLSCLDDFEDQVVGDVSFMLNGTLKGSDIAPVTVTARGSNYIEINFTQSQEGLLVKTKSPMKLD